MLSPLFSCTGEKMALEPAAAPKEHWNGRLADISHLNALPSNSSNIYCFPGASR